MLSIKDLLAQATEKLQKANIKDARHNATLLLMDLLNCNKAYLLAHNKDILSSEIAEHYQRFIERRSKGEPPQYILGYQEFYGRKFTVNPNVLIPRPETELMIELVIKLVKELNILQPKILDVGTGSGSIAITLACELPLSQITAIDISPRALKVAHENASKHQVIDRINWVYSDLVKELSSTEEFHFCCANLPYISPSEKNDLAKEVRDYEPELALFAPEEGLALTKKLFNDVVPLIYSGGYLICEIGFGQEKALLESVNLESWQIEETLKDLQGIARTIVLRRK
ncbi:MAG: peptide chain release factor N(5)-glutamine methyltransferase [Acidobacteria bacterium]|nr:peptide chain release factor N(5)-glutamine methyltransferase [Acidobacteriota bacterium]